MRNKRTNKKGGSRQYFEGNRNLLKSKRSMELEMLGWIIMGVVVLVIVVVGLIILSKKGIGVVDFLKNIFTFGR